MGGNRLQLGLGKNNTLLGFSLSKPSYTEHPVLQRLALLQQLETGHPPLEQMQFSLNSGFPAEVVDVLSILELIKQSSRCCPCLAQTRAPCQPELVALRPALLTLAGQRAMMQGEMGCAADFWQRLQREQDFNPQLAVNLMKVLELNGDYQELQRLLTNHQVARARL